jgi:hypothetical protein
MIYLVGVPFFVVSLLVLPSFLSKHFSTRECESERQRRTAHIYKREANKGEQIASAGNNSILLLSFSYLDSLGNLLNEPEK